MAHNKNNNKKGYSAPALEKGMDIIELLADAESGLTISEISERLKRRMSELFRIIIVMERRGWLRKDPENARFSVSYHLLLLAHRGTPAQTLTAAAAPVMQELCARTDQSCHLVIRSGGDPFHRRGGCGGAPAVPQLVVQDAKQPGTHSQ